MNYELGRFRVNRDKALVLVIDVQEKLVPAIDRSSIEPVIETIDMLLRGAEIIGLPVMVSEQYPRGLGHTVGDLTLPESAKVLPKTSFGCCGDADFKERLKDSGRSQVIVSGVEAHVCVYQTVLGLLEDGFDVHLVRDGVCSRRPDDLRAGLDNSARAGAVLTSAETVLFQLMGSSSASEFKAISALVKGRTPAPSR